MLKRKNAKSFKNVWPDRKNAKSAETVWLAACGFVDQVRRGRRRGLKFSGQVDQMLTILEMSALAWAERSFQEVYPAKARRDVRLAMKRTTA